MFLLYHRACDAITEDTARDEVKCKRQFYKKKL